MGSGQATTPDSEYLRLIALHPDPVVTASDLAAQLPVTQQAVNKRLNRLQSDGMIYSKKVGASARVYWLSRAGKERLAEETTRWRQSSSQ